MNRLIVGVITLLISLGFGIGVELASEAEKPYCPSEDSCTVAYRDGEWHISEVAP